MRESSRCLEELLLEGDASSPSQRSRDEIPALTVESDQLSSFSKTVRGRALLISTDKTGAPIEYLKPESVDMESRVSYSLPEKNEETGEYELHGHDWAKYAGSCLVSLPSSSSPEARDEDSSIHSRRWTLTPSMIKYLASF